MGKMHVYLGEVHTCRMPHDILHFLDELVEERYQILLSILLVSTLMKTHKKLVQKIRESTQQNETWPLQPAEAPALLQHFPGPQIPKHVLQHCPTHSTLPCQM